MISRRSRRILYTALFILIIFYLAANIFIYWPQVHKIIDWFHSSTAKIIHVIDGDSILVLENDEVKEVRLIGFNAPELATNGKPEECLAEDSMEKLQDYFNESRSITIESDSATGDKDQFDRNLRYITLPNGTDIAQDMIKNGFGSEMTVQPFQKEQQYLDAQAQAQANKAGIWNPEICSK